MITRKEIPVLLIHAGCPAARKNNEVIELGNLIDKMERKFGRYAIRNLMVYVSILYVIGCVIMWIDPMLYINYLSLDVGAILHGQIWRVVTFLMLPPDTNPILLAISIFFYIYLGRTLESIWGSFKFNLYYFTGVILTVIAAFIAYFISPNSYLMIGSSYLNFSMFLAFAVNMPDQKVLLYFLIPIKVKWVAYVDAAFLAITLVRSFLRGDYGTCLAIIVALLNFIIFYFGFMRRQHSPKDFIRRQKFKRAVNQGYQRGGYTNGGRANGGQVNSGYAGAGPSYRGAPGNVGGKRITRHHCAVCGRSELDGDDLEFRFCSKCNGNYEYCQDHLFTHKHIQ